MNTATTTRGRGKTTTKKAGAGKNTAGKNAAGKGTTPPTRRKGGETAEAAGPDLLKATRVPRLPIEQVAQHPLNTEFRLYSEAEKQRLRAMLDSNKKGHEVHPLVVVPAADPDGNAINIEDGRRLYWVTDGNHRLEYYQKKGHREVPVLISTMNPSDQVRDLANANRGKSLSDLEAGLLYLSLEAGQGHKGMGRPSDGAAGISVREFAPQIGVSYSTLAECVRAAKVYRAWPEEVKQEFVNYEGVDGKQAVRVTRDHLLLLEEMPVEDQVRFIRTAMKYGMSVRQLETAIKVDRGELDGKALNRAVSDIFGGMSKGHFKVEQIGRSNGPAGTGAPAGDGQGNLPGAGDEEDIEGGGGPAPNRDEHIDKIGKQVTEQTPRGKQGAGADDNAPAGGGKPVGDPENIVTARKWLNFPIKKALDPLTGFVKNYLSPEQVEEFVPEVLAYLEPILAALKAIPGAPKGVSDDQLGLVLESEDGRGAEAEKAREEVAA